MRPAERRSPMAMPAPRLKDRILWRVPRFGHEDTRASRRAACSVQSKRHHEHRSRSRGGDEPLCHPSVIMRSYTDQPGKAAQEQSKYSSRSGDRDQSQHIAQITPWPQTPFTEHDQHQRHISRKESSADSQVETQWCGNKRSNLAGAGAAVLLCCCIMHARPPSTETKPREAGITQAHHTGI